MWNQNAMTKASFPPTEAAGDLDSLAVRGRFLDYKYGNALDGSEGAET